MKPTRQRLSVKIEVPQGGRVKRLPDGSIDFVSPLACPFAYGSVLDTLAADGDPEDALVIGEAPKAGEVVERQVWGRVRFVDGGVEDSKWVVGIAPPSEADWRSLDAFFRRYAWAKRLLYVVRMRSPDVRLLGVERTLHSAG